MGCVALCLHAAWIAWRLQPGILVDDAAITFRYAERLAAGLGFTYNDHERVLGASNPLYVLLLSIGPRVGLDVELLARSLGGVLFTASALFGALIVARLSTRPFGIAAGILLASQPFFRDQMLSGMETGLAVSLGLLVILSLLDQRQDRAAVFMGLALWTKLDAAMLALGASAAWCLVHKRFPLRSALISLGIVLPWWIFATRYFGSPIPQSLVSKLANNTHLPPNRLWVPHFLMKGLGAPIALSSIVFWPSVWRLLAPHQRVGALSLAGWGIFHAVALSAVWLGDTYSWYLAVLVPPFILLACAGVGRSWIGCGLPRLGVRAVVAAASAVLLVVAAVKPVSSTLHALADGRLELTRDQRFDFDRRLAGLWLAEHAAPSEVVMSYFGWVAREIRNPFNDGSRLNSRRMLEPESYAVLHGDPYHEGFHPPTTPRGFVPLATFNLASDMTPAGFTWFVVFGARDSVVARSRSRYIQWRLFELPPWSPCPDRYGAGEVQLAGASLSVHPPGGATFAVSSDLQPVHLVFTPSLRVDERAAGSEDLEFQVLFEGEVVYRKRVSAKDPPAPAIVPLPRAEERESITFSLVNAANANAGGADAVAVWESVKVVVGDAYVDLSRIGNSPLAMEWGRRNPVAAGDDPSSRSDSPLPSGR